jgi:hypothetical protein
MPPIALDQVSGLFERLYRACGHGHPSAGAGKSQRKSATEASASSRHERNLTGQVDLGTAFIVAQRVALLGNESGR